MRLKSAILSLLALVAQPALAAPMNMRVFTLSDHLWCFYDGRPDEAATRGDPKTWADFGANNVGVATYVIHQGDRALVYDTFPGTKQAQWVRTWLEKAGIHRFIVANSHWHLDHVGGNAVYADSDLITTAATRERLVANRAAIEAGTLEGPPAINPLKLPDVTIATDSSVWIGSIRVDLRPVHIHSDDGLVLYLPADRVLLAGDTLEDTVTFIAEPATIPAQYRALAAMRAWGIDHIFPNHGNPDVIAKGGYGLGLIDATRAYIRHMVEHAHDPDFLSQPIATHAGPALARGDVSLWWAYPAAHAENLAKVSAAWKDKPLPDFGP